LAKTGIVVFTPLQQQLGMLGWKNEYHLSG